MLSSLDVSQGAHKKASDDLFGRSLQSPYLYLSDKNTFGCFYFLETLRAFFSKM